MEKEKHQRGETQWGGGKHLREALRKRESLREGDLRGRRHLRGKTHGKR